MRVFANFLSLIFLFTFSAFSCVSQNQAERTLLLVLNKSAASLSVLDAESMKLLRTIPVGDSPHEVVTSPDGKMAFVANYGAQTPGSTISVIDLIGLKELRRVELGPLIRPHGIQEIGGKIYFTAEASRAIARYDPAVNKVDWIMGTGQNASHMIAGSKDQKNFYTANIGSDNVTAIELQGLPPAASRIAQIPVGKQPEAIDISPDGAEVWVGLNAEAAVDIVSTAEKKVVGRVDLGARPYRVRFSPDGKRVFSTLPNTKEIVITNVADRKEIIRLKLDSSPLGIVFSRDGKWAFVTTIQRDSVLKIDLQKLEVVGQGETGTGPDGIALAEM